MHPGRTVVFLVVADERLRSVLRTALASFDHIELASEAGSCPDGLVIAEGLGPHITIVSHNLPVLVDVQYARDVHERHLPTRVILLDRYETGDGAAAGDVIAARFGQTLSVAQLVETATQLFRSL